jgi:hypothetical protein
MRFMSVLPVCVSSSLCTCALLEKLAECPCLLASYLLMVIFDPEDGGNIFLPHLGHILQDRISSRP